MQLYQTAGWENLKLVQIYFNFWIVHVHRSISDLKKKNHQTFPLAIEIDFSWHFSVRITFVAISTIPPIYNFASL